jgi:hypothetical protein
VGRQVRVLVATAVFAAREAQGVSTRGMEGAREEGTREEDTREEGTREEGTREDASGLDAGESIKADEPRLTLLHIATSGRQELTAHPAPPTGLVFANSGLAPF